MASRDENKGAKGWRDIGQALGGLARKVGQMVDDLQETARLPEGVRSSLDALASLGRAEDFAAAQVLVLDAGEPDTWSPELLGAAYLMRVHAAVVSHPLSLELVERLASAGEREGVQDRPELRLWNAWRSLERGDALAARDALRRAARRRELLSRRQHDGFDDLHALIEARAHLTSGFPQRAQRVVMTRMARRNAFEATELDLLFVELAVDIWLAIDEVELAQELRTRLRARAQEVRKSAAQPDASRSQAGRARVDPHDVDPHEAASQRAKQEEGPPPRPDRLVTERVPRFAAAQERLDALWARVESCRGDRDVALRWLEQHPDLVETELVDLPPWRERTALRLALHTGALERARAAALRSLKAAPSDPELLRVWALSTLRVEGQGPAWTQSKDRAATAIESLWPRVDKLEGWARREALREVAFVAVHAGVWSVAKDRRIFEESEPTPEIALLRLGAQLANAEVLDAPSIHKLLRDQDLVAGQSPLRLPRVEGPHGIDELSPLRDAETRESLVAAHAQVISSQLYEALGRGARAHDCLIDALIEQPQLEIARARLVQPAQVGDDPRIEALMSEATRRLAALPRQVSGVAVQGIDNALERVVAIRERLARPLTIAIMGEFSSGKSTFVNAWLGRQLAPMGALPTTCTINVFRYGGQGLARIHRRDGRIELVAKSDLLTFLAELDEASARTIRHVEIERGELGAGHASIVDTPGLNALDPYHEQVAREFLAEADAVVWVFSATQGAAASERAMLDELRGDGRKVLGILNKVDVLDEGEDHELMTYLREKLGEVLVDVLPLSAQAALAWRESQRPASPTRGEDAAGDTVDSGTPSRANTDDPMLAVDGALERHFLAKARELKEEICRRELAAALQSALEGLEAAASALDASSPTVAAIDLPTLRVQLSRIIDRVCETWAESADSLNRELMALGVYEAQRGAGPGRPDEHDHAYFAARVAPLAASAMARCLFEIRDEDFDDALLDAAADRLLPWLRGYLGGLDASGSLRGWLEGATLASEKGEEAAKEALATTLRSMENPARDELARVESQLLASLRAGTRRQRGRAPAQALSLRAQAQGQLHPLLSALQV